MCEKTRPHLIDDFFINLSKQFAKNQNDDILDEYFAEARKQCNNYGITICDMRLYRDKLSASGVDITELLANRLNHPIREMHYYMAIKLIETMFEN